MLALAVIYIIKFGGPSLLRQYVQAGIGIGQQQPVFSIAPETEIVNPQIDKKYLAELKLYRLRNIEICLPQDIKVVQEEITKIYYKKRPWRSRGGVAYLLYQKPRFFIGLFPQVLKQGIVDDYSFMEHTLSAKIEDIKTVSDAFFVVMKSIFTPDLGDQKNVKIVKIFTPGKKGFLSYNIGRQENYFDCNMFDGKGNYFKLYIKGRAKSMDLNKVLTIISSLKMANP